MGAPGETVLDVVLEAGDTLYLPRGWMHEALTSDEDSLHLTVGVNVAPWADAVRAAVARAEDDVAFRRGVPDDGAGAEGLFDRLAAELEPERVAAARRRAFVDGRRPILTGQLEQLRRLDAIDAETVVERRETVIAELRRRRPPVRGQGDPLSTAGARRAGRAHRGRGPHRARRPTRAARRRGPASSSRAGSCARASCSSARRTSRRRTAAAEAPSRGT